jgi:hypothetical protein
MPGGRIEARSNESGRGSAFVVDLPVVDEAFSAQPPRGPTASSTSFSLNSMFSFS